MDWNDIFKIVTGALLSIGTSSMIIFALSSWLGKVWANRILIREKQAIQIQLEETKQKLDIIKETALRFQNDKILTYRAIVDIVSGILASFDALQTGRLDPKEATKRFDYFNQERLKLYGYLAMLAPQNVMDAQDQLMDHLLMIANGSVKYEWSEVRRLAINLLNEVRKDIGIAEQPIEYRGNL